MTDQAEDIKQRIERRGPIAKDVILDVEAFKPTLAKSLLDEITLGKTNDKFQSQLHPILIVPQQLIKGSLCTGNVQQFLEKGNYVEDSTDREQPV